MYVVYVITKIINSDLWLIVERLLKIIKEKLAIY